GILLRVGDRPNIQVAVSALFLVALGRTGAVHAGVARLWETAIGAVVTLVVAVLLWPPDPVRELRQRLDRLRQALAVDLALVADSMAFGGTALPERMDDIRAHSVDAVREVLALEQARRALRFNPLRRRDAVELGLLEDRMNLAARIYRHGRSVARDVADTAVQSPELAAALRAIAGVVDLALRDQDVQAALDEADERLATAQPQDTSSLIVRAQLSQMLADLHDLVETRRRYGPPRT